MRQSTINPATCLDFDLAVVSFWDWYEAKSHERVAGRDPSPKLRKGQVLVEKYPTVASILDLYGAHLQTAGFGQDPLAATINLQRLASDLEADTDQVAF